MAQVDMAKTERGGDPAERNSKINSRVGHIWKANPKLTVHLNLWTKTANRQVYTGLEMQLNKSKAREQTEL